MGLSYRLQSIHAHGVLLSYLHDLAKRTLSYHLEQLEYLDGEWLGSRGSVVYLEMERAAASSSCIPLVGCMLRGQVRDESRIWKVAYMTV